MKTKILFIINFIVIGALIAQPKFSSINSSAGSFSRMGFGARGIAMGNAVSSVNEGNLVSYYNPALSPFQLDNSFQTSYSILSLDRSLNFLSYTRRFTLGQKVDGSGNTKPRSIAGISAGIINAGVSKIDSRDNQGRKAGDISTSENQFFVSVANRFSEKLSIGIGFKFYYYSLYEQVSATSLGFDIGAIYSFNESLSFSFVISDINSKYEWDTGKIYGTSGLITKNNFPLLKKFGASYKIKNPDLIVALELESSNAGSNYLRAGSEYNIYDGLFLRAGFDKLNLSNSDTPIRPSAGFGYYHLINSFKIGLDYAFVIEPYSAGDQHIVGININF